MSWSVQERAGQAPGRQPAGKAATLEGKAQIQQKIPKTVPAFEWAKQELSSQAVFVPSIQKPLADSISRHFLRIAERNEL